jgi:predicted transcriptional regulator
MFQKIANALSIVSFIMVASMSGGTYFAYKYVTSEQFKAKVMTEIMANVQTLMPKVLDNTMPDISGPSIPILKK